MIRLQVINGGRAGEVFEVSHYPAVLGRSAALPICLEDPGVWDKHARIELDPAEGFSLVIEPKAIGSVNGNPVESARLRNGDLIDLGSARLRFWISDPERKSLVWREAVVWIGLVGITIAEGLVLFFLLR